MKTDSAPKYLTAYREIIKLGLPIVVGQLGTIVVSFADNIMVGHYSTEALASASFVNNLFNMAVLCCIGFSYGLTPLAGALYGAGKRASTGAVTRVALAINLLYALMLTAVMLIIYFNLHRLGQPAELMPLIRPYYILVLCTLVPTAVFNVGGQWCYAINRTALPMWIILGANLLNIFGNWLLIYGNWGCPELGLFGAGISTLVSRVLGAAVIFALFMGMKSLREYRNGLLREKAQRGISRRVWKTSLPVSMQLTFESGSFTAAAVMVGWLGKVPLAAFQIIVTIGTLGFMVYYGIGSAVSVKVANEAGRDNSHGMRRYAWAGYHIMIATMTVSSLIFVLGGPWMMGLFSKDPAVVGLAVSLIGPLVLYQFGDATQVTFANALRGTSHVMPMLWIAFASYVLVGMPATYILAFTCNLETYGVILSFSVSLFMAGALFLRSFVKASRK